MKTKFLVDESKAIYNSCSRCPAKLGKNFFGAV